jgi:hypothetical protein
MAIAATTAESPVVIVFLIKGVLLKVTAAPLSSSASIGIDPEG